MLSAIKSLFGLGPKVNYKELMQRGAVIIDVRSKGEFASGHIKGAKNIPLDVLGNNLNGLDKSKPVITCCASGMRSGAAKGMLKSKGFNEVHNGGAWVSLNNKI
ncbi:MAG: rhodanese-like domain-containing protein [Crocinitomicaceae bacterium]|jgi:phage shock protein E|nr:rhodanese-like domain-containing protein [Crocinitomicaceae bacterium]